VNMPAGSIPMKLDEDEVTMIEGLIECRRERRYVPSK